MKQIVSYTAAKQEGIILNANEMSSNLKDEIRAEIAQAVSEISFNRYPDTDQTELLEAYSGIIGLPAEQLLAGNGSDQLLGFVIGYYLGRGKRLYTFDPDFSMYDYYASGYEAEMVKYDLTPGRKLDVDDFIENGRKQDIHMVMFSNPNNPSGMCLSVSDIRRIAEAFADIPVVVDEAYIEFADEESAVSLLDEFDKLYVTRTLSKAYGLAGMRVGFLAGRKENMAKLKQAFVPYALNAFSMKTAVIVLSHKDEIAGNIRAVRAERKRVYEAVKDMGKIRFYPGQANFLYASCSDKDALMEMFAEAGIVIRNYKGTDRLRITIGNKDENDQVLAVLKRFEEAA